MHPVLPATGCPECGAALAPGRACVDSFHDLLALESQVPGAAGGEPHFLAVASYNLQHPSAFMPASLTGLWSTVVDVLAGQATIADARHRARRATNGPTRVHRRADTPLPLREQQLLAAWPIRWTLTVVDVTGAAPQDYATRVRAWAQAVTTDLATVPALAAGRARVR